MRLIIASLIALVFFTSCSKKESDDSEMYIGAYRMMDQIIPYPYIIQQKKDSIYLFDNKGNLIDFGRKDGDSSAYNFQQKHFKKLKPSKLTGKSDNNFYAHDLLDTINFRRFENGMVSPKDAAKFEKVSAVKKLDIIRLKNEIGNSIWKYNVVGDENSNPNEDLDVEQLLHFRNDSLRIITNYYYQEAKVFSEYESKTYTIFEIDHVYFLSLQKEKDNPQPIYQILGSGSKKLDLRYFSSRIPKDLSFHKNDISIDKFLKLASNTSSYSNCFDGYQGEYYYGDDVTYRKGNEYILELVNADAPKVDTESGYLIVHFNINCNADVGNFGLIQMDREFKKFAFSKEIVSHVLNKVSRLKDFPSVEVGWPHKDVHAFLMFKLERGKIIDLCP